ncbi:MAG: SGNH/GDSL hydrolase family protein [Bacteroidales bacterium]|nr:SGNH/GDSL hydrolase family protein [Bacteroidales bacterium]
MKKHLIVILAVAAALFCGAYGLSAQEPSYTFTDAYNLTLCGKAFVTPLPYERMDFDKFTGWTEKDINLLKMSSGIIVSFKTDSPSIRVKASFQKPSKANTSGFATRGFDLYIKKDGKWLWAGAVSASHGDMETKPMTIVKNMDRSEKECILYLPTFSQMEGVEIGVEEGSVIKRGAQPFRYKIILHGSSFMHGASTTRAGATVPGFLSRMTGLNFCSLGVSGDCKMQPQFAEALKGAKADAFVFDAFSNPSAEEIQERLFPFIETIQAGHPGKPLIFMSSIYRERRNFNAKVEEAEAAKAAMAAKMMKKACKKYKNVYFIQSNATTPDHETTCDGVHPGDMGYYLWAESVKDQIVKILAKYGLK